MEFWHALENSSDATAATEIETVLMRRQQGVVADSDVDLLFGSPVRLRLVLDAVAPHTVPWLEFLAMALTGRREILDLGCGGGAAACFLAWHNPGSSVVGVDRSEACLDTARVLARELGLANVQFVCGDITSIDVERRFDAVVSSAVWAEGDDAREMAPWLSALNALPMRLGDAANPLSRCVERHLSDEGVYVSLERCRDVAALGSWIGSLQSCGLVPDLGSSQMLDVDGVLTGPERLPAIVAYRGGSPVRAGQVLDWRLANGNPATEHELGTEIDVALGGPWSVVAGEVMEVDDPMGTMSAALCLMENGSDGLLYFTTTRGVREVLARTSEGGAAQFVPMYRSVRNSVGRRPSVRLRRPVEQDDADVAVPRLTFSWER